MRVVVAPRTLVTFVAVLLGGLLLLALAYATREILIQLLSAIVLAMALQPPVQALERRGLARRRAVGITFLLAVVAATAFGCILFPPLVAETTRFSHDAPDLLQRLTDSRGFGFLEHRFHVVESARTWIAERGGAEAIGRPALHLVGGVFHTAAVVVTVAFLTLFVALGGGSWFDSFLEVVPETSRERWRRIGNGTSKAVGGYVFGNLLISVVAGTFTTIVLLAARVPYPVPLGLVVAVLDLIPIVGATIGAVIVGAVALTKGITTTAIVVAAMWVYQEFENHTLVQVVYHRTVKLSPLAIAVSVAAGAEIGGIVGALLAIPAAGALKVVSRELLAWRRGEVPPEEAATPKRPWLTRWWMRTRNVTH